MRPLRPVPEPPSPGFTPTRLLEIELSRPLPNLDSARAPDGRRYEQALVFTRLHDEPLGLVTAELDHGRLSSDALAYLLWAELKTAIQTHLAHDDLRPVDRLSSGGIASGQPAACKIARDRFLTDAPPLSVIVPSRERPERLARCLDSILACEYPADRVEIIVVDNAPVTDSTRRLVEEYSRSTGRVRYAREDAPGSASARNRGLQVIRHDLVAMTDDDVLVDRHWLTELARTFQAFPAAASVTGLLLPMQLDTPAQDWFEQYGGFSRGFRRRIFDLQDHRPSGEPLYPWAAGIFGTGNNFAFRASRLRAMGAFDPALGNGTPALGGVDSEVLLRTILNGHQIVYEPRAVVHHAHRPDYAALRRQVYSYGVGLTAYYLKTLHDDPRRLLDFGRRLPEGLRWMRNPDAHVNQHKRDDYPPELGRLELRGMMYGPLAYVRSRRRYGPHRVRPQGRR